MKAVFHARIRDKTTGGCVVARCRFTSKRLGGPFEVGPAIVMAPPDSDTTGEDVFAACEPRLFRLAELLDQRRRNR